MKNKLFTKKYIKFFLLHFILILAVFFPIGIFIRYFSIKNNLFILIVSLILSIIITTLLMKNKKNIEKLNHLKKIDNLTKLYNRRTFLELFNKHYIDTKETNRILSLCFADLNNTKSTNNNLGNNIGDLIIKSFSEILKSGLRESDIISRFGGDKFLILFVNSDVTMAKKGWQRVLEKLNELNNENLYPNKITVSAGFSEFNPRIPKTIDMLINEAEFNMYNNKNHYKNTNEVIF
ncbi:MAG: GGDEF domain-containing protein [Candidatus Muirbacterium halophilum]|nr:GGDEF domain-containing protein [Candidatus Muirbacterium halophilum]